MVCSKFGCSMIGELGGSMIREKIKVGVGDLIGELNGEGDEVYTCSGVFSSECSIVCTGEIVMKNVWYWSV